MKLVYLPPIFINNLSDIFASVFINMEDSNAFSSIKSIGVIKLVFSFGFLNPGFILYNLLDNP